MLKEDKEKINNFYKNLDLAKKEYLKYVDEKVTHNKNISLEVDREIVKMMLKSGVDHYYIDIALLDAIKDMPDHPQFENFNEDPNATKEYISLIMR